MRQVSAGCLAKFAVAQADIDSPVAGALRPNKVSVIEEVKGFGAHLKTNPFGNQEILQEANIDAFHATGGSFPPPALPK